MKSAGYLTISFLFVSVISALVSPAAAERDGAYFTASLVALQASSAVAPGDLYSQCAASEQMLAYTEQRKSCVDNAIRLASLQDTEALPERPSEPSQVREELQDGGKVMNVTIRGDEKRVSISQERVPGRLPVYEGFTFPANNRTALTFIDKSITLFTVNLKERFELWLERSARYVEIMKGILKERRLPEELVFLPIIESGFNVNAYSRARAVGPWQFIEATAKRYGLVIDWWRDERKDPVKSTEAAASYLRDLHTMFGSWNLALAAYNAGEGRISRALRSTAADDLWPLLNTKQIRDETKHYVPRFFAATMIAHTPEDYGFMELEYHKPFLYDEVTINQPLDIEVIAQCAEASVKDIKDLNPELRRWSTPPNVDHYTVRIPEGRSAAFLDNLSQVPDEECFSFDTYKIKKGESIKQIARKLNVPLVALLSLNDLGGIEQLQPGEVLKVPPSDKFQPDLDDLVSAKKVSFVKKSASKQKEGVRAPKKGQRDSVRKKDRIKAKRA